VKEIEKVWISAVHHYNITYMAGRTYIILLNVQIKRKMTLECTGLWNDKKKEEEECSLLKRCR
jgi:hypothetical protein